ncbi:MAG: MMPL family transporter [Myxococcaceae bacterium]
MAAHLGVTLLASTLLLLGGLSLYPRATTEQDVGAMLPDGPGSPREAARLLSEFGALNTLLIDLELPGASEEQLAEEGHTLATALRKSGAFLEVFSGPSLQDSVRVTEVLFPRRLYLFADPMGEIERRSESKQAKVTLDALKRNLASLQAMVTKRDLLNDPLGFDADVLAGLTQLAGDVHPSHGELLSGDGRHLLLVTTPVGSALDAKTSGALLATVAREAAKLPSGPAGPAVVTAVGGPRFAAESAATVRRDVVITLLTSLVGLFLLFLIRFRNLRLLLLVFVPIGFGIVGGLAAVVLAQGHIHVLTFAFGSVLVGISIDYPLYLLNAASAQPGNPLERMGRALDNTWRSLWLGFSTTIIAFVMMGLSQFPGLRELALYAGGGIVIAFAATLILLVPLCAVWGPKRWSVIPRWMPALGQRALSPRMAGGAALCVLVASAVLAPRLRFDGELRHLDAQHPETLAEFEQVMNRFGLREADSLVVARGRTVQEALTVNDAVAAALSHSGGGGLSGVVSVSSFLPAVATQRERAQRLAALDVPQARARLSADAVEAGFSPTAFDGFWQEVSAVQKGKTSPLTPADLEQTSLAPLLARMLRCSGQGCIVVTSLEARSPAAVASLAQELPPGAVLLNAHVLAEDSVVRIPRQLAFLSGLGLLLNVLLLAFAYRSPRLAVVACFPGCLGLAGTIAILSAVHVPLNLVSASALVLILGCGVDYGIFALQGVTSPSPVTGVESTGVLLTSLTALAGFGTLVLASYRALQFLGAAVGLGILLSSIAAIFLLPGLHRLLVPGVTRRGAVSANESRGS